MHHETRYSAVQGKMGGEARVWRRGAACRQGSWERGKPSRCHWGARWHLLPSLGSPAQLSLLLHTFLAQLEPPHEAARRRMALHSSGHSRGRPFSHLRSLPVCEQLPRAS